MRCEFAHDDAAYVLGSLPPTERIAFERHLATCADCSRSVRELAGLPGLLSRVDPAVLEEPQDVAPVPETLLPTLVARVRRERRRRVWLSTGLVAAAAAAVAVTWVAVGQSPSDRAPVAGPLPTASSSSPSTRALTMAPVHGQREMVGTMTLRQVAWGTRLDLTCSYPPVATDYQPLPAATYTLVVHTRDGRTQRVATWHALPGRTMQVASGTAVDRAKIASVEVRTSGGRPVLRLTL